MSLKILHIASGDRWAGAEVQLYTLVRASVQMVPTENLAVILLNQGTLAEKLQKIGVKVYILDESTLGSLRILWEMISLIREIQPDIVHTHRSKENILGAIASLIGNRAICLRTSHGAPEYSARGIKAIIPKLDQWVGKHLQAAIIAVSDELKHKLRRHFPTQNITVIANGIDCEYTQQLADSTAKQTTFDPDYYHIGLIGRLEPVKRGDLFIEIARIVTSQEDSRRWRFHIFGDGSEREKLERLSRAYQLDETVVFHGHSETIHPYIAALDAVIMCSDHEGLPMTALECLCLKTPLIAHKTGGLASLLADNCGIAVPHAVPAYVAAVDALFANAEQRLNYIENGQKKIEQTYSAAINARNVLKLYRQLAPNTRAAG